MSAVKPVVHASPPTQCDLCQRPITKDFVDGRTQRGPWGNLCLGCHRSEGVGLGTGKGQKYERNDAGDYVKVAG